MKINGFSLIELTVVVGLTSILVISITAIAMTSLLNATRVRNLVRTRQSGDTATTQLKYSLRNARVITLCDSSLNVLTIENSDGNATTISLIDDGTTTRIASNSAYLTPQDATILDFDLSCIPSDAEPELINIKFLVTSRIVSTRSVETPTIPFELSVQLRNE